MKRNILLLSILFISILIACNYYKPDSSTNEMREIVESRNKQLGECFKSGDAEKLAQMYTDSAKLCPNGSDFVLGRENISAFWAEDFKTSRIIEMNTQVLTVDGTMDVIYETGIAESKIMYNDSLYTARVKYINVWRKQPDGNYLLDIDFWNKPGN